MSLKTFIKKSLLFCAIPAAVILTMDIWLRNQDTLYSVKYEGAKAEKDSIQLIILGNSHATYGVDPAGFSVPAFNLANVSQSIYFDKRITLSLLDNMTELKYVLISVDYHSLYFSSQKVRDDWSYFGNGIKYKDKSYFAQNLSPSLFGYTPKIAISLLKKRAKNLIRHKGKALTFDVETGINKKGKFSHGFISFENEHKPEKFTTEKMENRSSNFTNMMQTSKEKEEVIQDLTEFIKELQKRGIEPILFATPTYGEYNKLLDKELLEINSKDIETLCSKYGLKYLNHMTSVEFKLNDFFNPDHLNKQGALKFSEILNKQIIKK